MRSFVYIISASVYCKVGRSNNPTKRLSEIATGCPVVPCLEHFVECEMAEHVEALSHSLLDAYRSNGEWFRVSVDDAKQAVEQARKLAGGSLSQWSKSTLEKAIKRTPRKWSPNPELFTRTQAAAFIRKQGTRGCTREVVNRFGIPWPLPKRWQMRTKNALASYYHFKKEEIENARGDFWKLD